MIIKEIIKLCARCGERYEIPNIKESRARDKMIEFYPCCHCGYVKDILYPKNNKSGRCRDCSIPFTIIDHHGKGRCKRCYMKYLRDNATKDIINNNITE